MNKLEQRVIELSKKHNLSHIGSCLTSVNIIDEIFSIKKPDEKFILSAGHAGLALYVVLEKYGYDAEYLLKECGVHPVKMDGIDCSTGSLGQGLTIAVGIACADRNKNVYCLISDGESFEGCIWEALEYAYSAKLFNLRVYVNINGWSAYRKVDIERLAEKLGLFLPWVRIKITKVDSVIKWGHPLEAHYLPIK